MERLIGETLKAFGGGGALLAAAFAVAWWLFSDLHKQQGKGWWIALLRHDGLARRYRALMAAALDRLDARLSPGCDATPGAPKTEAARAWSHGLLDLCLLLAVAYPILSLLVYWAVTGGAGRVGPLVVLEAEPERLNRAAAIGAVWLAVAGARLFIVASTRRRRFVAVVMMFAGAGLFFGSGLVKGEGAITVGSAGAGVVAITLARAVAGAVVGAIAASVAVAMSVGAAYSEASVGFALIAVSLAVAGASAQASLGLWTKLPTTALGAFMLLLCLALLITGVVVPPGKDLVHTFLLFLGFLPLLNAAADFASVGLTRWLLRRGVRGNLAWNAGLDALSALAVLLALGFAIIATVHLARPAGGAPLIDLAALFADLRDPAAAHDYYWLYFCFFSTLLPTALHLGVGCFGLFTLASKRLGQPIAAGLASPVEATRRAASLAFTICAALAVWAPAMLIWQALVWFGRPALDGLLWAFEGFARLIGAL